MIKVYAVVGVIVLCLSGALYREISLHAKAKQKVEILNNTIEEYKSQIEVQEQKHKELAIQKKLTEEEFNEVKVELDKYKGRQQTLIKKPRLVEKKINESFASYVKDMRCVTGSSAQCE